VFNPSATVAGLSEHLWKLEQPAHAVANGYFIGAINRVGVEAPWNIGEFYGSSYFCDPRGQIIAQASRDKDEVLTADLDLDLIGEVRKTWQFFRDRRPDMYVMTQRTGIRREVRRDPSAARPPRGAGRGEPLPVLLRCALRQRVPHAYRRAGLHQENRERKSWAARR
jgi:hypothetical protein